MATRNQRRDGRFDRRGRLRPVVVERLGRDAMAEAIAGPKEAGRSIYYADRADPGFVIEEKPDGRRYLPVSDIFRA